MKQGKESSGLI